MAATLIWKGCYERNSFFYLIRFILKFCPFHKILSCAHKKVNPHSLLHIKINILKSSNCSIILLLVISQSRSFSWKLFSITLKDRDKRDFLAGQISMLIGQRLKENRNFEACNLVSISARRSRGTRTLDAPFLGTKQYKG